MKIIFILFTFSVTMSFAQQNDTVYISGRINGTKGMYVEGLIVMIKQPSDSSIITYCMTDEEGNYCTKFIKKQKEVLVHLSGFNVKREIRKVNAISQTLNFKAEEESIALQEVQIKAQKIWGNRDTLNYLVAAYTKEFDRTIGDVLKELPGITIDNGIIKYQGTAINHFYIENMDILQGRYNLATEGLKAENVATVQVLENHESVKALQDQLPPESAAINLKLKEKAKGIWTKSFGLGLGYDDGIMWNTEANAMFFGKRSQHVVFYGNDNTGKKSNRSIRHYGGGTLGATVLTNIMTPGSSPVGSMLHNNQHSFNMSNLTKLNETAQLHYNITYNHDIKRLSSYTQTTYILPDTDMRIVSEDISSRHTTNDANIQLSYENNTEKRFLYNALEISGQWTEANGMVQSNDEQILQHAYNRNLGLLNETHWIHRTESGGGFDLLSRNSVQTTPQALSISGDMEARQELNITKINSSNNFSLIQNLRRRRWTVVPTAAINVNYIELESMLKTATPDDGKMKYLYAGADIGATLRYVKNDFRMTFRFPLSLSYTDVFGETKATQAWFSPSFNLLWKASDNWTFTGGANYGMNQTPWTQLVTFYVMSNYRTTSRYATNLSNGYSVSTNTKIN